MISERRSVVLIADEQIDYRHADVRRDLLKWGTWVLEVSGLVSSRNCFSFGCPKTTGATGFRIDAMKHIDRKFVRDFVCLHLDHPLPRCSLPGTDKGYEKTCRKTP